MRKHAMSIYLSFGMIVSGAWFVSFLLTLKRTQLTPALLLFIGGFALIMALVVMGHAAQDVSGADLESLIERAVARALETERNQRELRLAEMERHDSTIGN